MVVNGFHLVAMTRRIRTGARLSSRVCALMGSRRKCISPIWPVSQRAPLQSPSNSASCGNASRNDLSASVVVSHPRTASGIEAVLIAKIGKPPHAGALGCEGVVADGRPKRIGLQKQRRWCRHQGSAASSQEGRESPATAKLLGFSSACQSSHMRRYAASTLRRNRSVSNNG